jgi:hypothetical protein
VILRELHKIEQDKKVIYVLEKLVSVLIADEPEEGMENLHQVMVPEDLAQKFYDYETKELEKNFEE